MTTQRSGVLSGGSWIADILKTVDRYPPEDELALILDEGRACGGPAFNLVADLRLLGATFPLGAVGMLGDDDNGAFIRSTLSALGVDAQGMRMTADAPSAYVDVMTNRQSGRRTFFYREGAAGLLTPEDFDFSACGHRIFHCGAPGLHSRMDQFDPAGQTGFSRVLRAAQAAGMRTNMELVTLAPDRQRALAAPCLPWLNSLVVNEHEAGPLAQRDLRPGGEIDWAEVEAACRRIRGLGPFEMVAIHFPEGGVAIGAEGEPIRQGAVRVPPDEIRSAVGAGDAFAAGMVLGWHEDWDIGRRLELAVAAAAQSLRGETTTSAMCDWRDCLDAAMALGHWPSG
jgi:sugar/nucleoside kinase (ribokinase family)